MQDPNAAYGISMEILHCAAEVGSIDILQFLINEFEDYLDIGSESNLFHNSALNGHYLFIKYAIDHHPEYKSLLHSTNDDDELPIHKACS